MPTLSICIIVKNEEEVIARCLSSTGAVADEIIIVDTGSTDNTLAICSQFPVNIHHFTWCDNFAAARNYSFGLAKSDYILWLDADDVLKPEDLHKLEALKPQLQHDVYYLKYDYALDEHGNPVCTLFRERIVKNDERFRWKYPVHEVIDCSQAASFEYQDIVITHHRTSNGFAADKNRNLAILINNIADPRYSGDARMWYYLGKEYQDDGQFQHAIEAFKQSMALNNGWVEDQVSCQYRIAQCYYALVNTDSDASDCKLKAYYHAKQAIKMDDRLAEPYYVLGLLAYDDQLFDEAIFWFKKCLRPLPDILSPVNKPVYTLQPLLHLMFCYHAMGDHLQANEYNEQALALKPGDAGLLHNRQYIKSQFKERYAHLAPQLNFCGGVFKKEGYINCDQVAGDHVDLVCDATNMLFDDGSITEINNEYGLSHLPGVKTRLVLQEWHRLLTAGGKLIVREHDLVQCAERLYKSKTAEELNWYRSVLYGFQSQHPVKYDPQFERISGYSKEEWIREIKAAGFEIEKVNAVDIYGTPSVEIKAKKAKVNVVKRIGWVVGNEMVDARFPSYRIRALNMNKALQETGFLSELVYDLSEAGLEPLQVLVFFKAINQAEYELMIKMKEKGKTIVFDIAEDLFEYQADFPFYLPMLQAASLVICCSHKLAEKVAAVNTNVFVVEDAIETDMPLQKEPTDTGVLKVGWIGMTENCVHAENLRPLIEACGYELVTIHNGENASVQWHPDTWQTALLQCDIAIAPLDVEKQPCKSNNKVTTYMALGLPVIAAPLDAYKRIIQNGINGFIAEDEAAWRTCLLALKDAAFRNEVGALAQCSALAYRQKNIALKLARILTREEYNSQATDIIIPTIYNPTLLQICVKSIFACTQVPFNIIVINNGGHSHQLDESVTIINADQLNYSASINLGIQHGSAPYICIMNDDVVVSDGWLPPMIQSFDNENIGFCNPLSNSELGIMHNYEMRIGDVSLQHCNNYLSNNKIYEKGIISKGLYPESLYSYVPPYARRQLFINWVAFYCTLTTRAVIEKVGLLDDAFNNGCEDVDLCHRGNRMGLQSTVNENSFVFHFGGSSTQKYITINPEQKGETHRIYHQKYAKPLLVIYTGFAFEPWNGEIIEQKGMGGSETAAARMGEEFVALGYRVIVFCECDNTASKFKGVKYEPIGAFPDFINKHFIDVFIVSRYINVMNYPVRAAKKYLWVHDVFAMGAELGEGDLVKKYQHAFDAIFCLSNWHKEYFQYVHGIDGHNIIVTQNGIDVKRFDQHIEKIPNRFIYSSSPDRSLDKVLRIFPKIRSRLPDATLHIFYGFENFEKSLPHSANTEQHQLYNDILELMQQEGVVYHGRIDQKSLAAEFLKSDIWLYPTQFTETYCITALEAQLAETVCICSPVGALETTVGERGILINHDPLDSEYDNKIVATILDIQNDPDKKQQLLRTAKEWALQQSWQKVAGAWHELFLS
jgi:glycosyltransferase involved in cell wall biosynthesis